MASRKRWLSSASPGDGEVPLRVLEGLPVNLWRGMRAVATSTRRLSPRAHVGLRMASCTRTGALATLILVAIALTGASLAHANEASKILQKCAHGEPFSGYSQKAYREALKQMPTEVSEYTNCSNLISKDELTTAGGGGGAAAEAASSNIPLPLTSADRRALQSAHRNGSTPVQVGREPIRPGVVRAYIASALNTLPHPLFATLAFMLAGALVLAIGDVRKRVRARRHG